MSKTNSIFYSDDEIKTIVDKNIINMLKVRQYITDKSRINNLDEHMEIIVNDSESKLKNEKIYVKFYNIKADNIQNVKQINDFINEYDMHHKIIIVDNYNTKIYSFFRKIDNVELFKKEFFLINIIDHIASPHMSILSEEDKIKFKTEYNVSKINIMKILQSDPMVAYFNAKQGDIFKIIRPSKIAVNGIGYREVI
jgi:DNA-directed RNA polymerase subunit H (RpoH/RPB5)